MKRRGLKDGKWTFSGFHDLTKDENLLDAEHVDLQDPILTYTELLRRTHNADPKANKEGLQFDGMLVHLLNDIDMDELVDVRENSAYVAFVQLIGGYINYEEDGYDILAKEYKRELKYSGGNIMELQLREVVDRSVHEFTSFFTSIPKFEQFEKSFDDVIDLKKHASKKLSFLHRTAKSKANKATAEINASNRKDSTSSVSDMKFTNKGNVMSNLILLLTPF
jgi:CO dehydrogenase/acetyl-CoA synthase beta subunit